MVLENDIFTVCAILGLIAIFATIYIDYKRSECALGGSNCGKDNWVSAIFRKAAKKIASAREARVADVCDV